MEDKPSAESAEPAPPDNLEDVDPDTLRELAQAQLEEAEARKHEVELEKRRLEEQSKQAKHSLKAQREDNDSERQHQDRIHQRNSRYGIAIIGGFLFFLGFLVWDGQPDMAFEIIKVIVYGGVGYAAGNQYGKGVAIQENS